MTSSKTTKVIKFYEDRCNGCLECMKACSLIHFKTNEGSEKSAIKILNATAMTIHNFVFIPPPSFLYRVFFQC